MLQTVIDADQLERVAMFPLPNVVLLPGSLLPLHIFEPRYRDMIRDVLDGSGLLAMARLKAASDTDVEGPPPVYSTVGVGRVIDSQELPDGRYHILVRGLIRAIVVEEHPLEHPYREVRAKHLSDQASELPGILAATQQKLISLCDQLSLAIDEGGSDFRQLARSMTTPGTCADMISSVLLSDPDNRQELLETRDPLQRLECIIKHVDDVITQLGIGETDPETMN